MSGRIMAGDRLSCQPHMESFMVLDQPPLATLLICGPYMRYCNTHTHTHTHTRTHTRTHTYTHMCRYICTSHKVPPKALMRSVLFPLRFDEKTEGVTLHITCPKSPDIPLDPPSAGSPDFCSLQQLLPLSLAHLYPPLNPSSHCSLQLHRPPTPSPLPTQTSLNQLEQLTQ